MKHIIYSSLLTILYVNNISAQNSATTTLATDFVSQYVWRGQDCGNISIQPTLGIEYGSFSASAWGSIGFDADDTKEFDLTLSYSVGKFNIGVTDYWFSNGVDEHGRYFKYKAHCTNHLFEANVGFDFGHFSLQWFTNFAGNDGVNLDGKRAYSSYFEIVVPFTAVTLDWEAVAGAVPYATDFYDVRRFAVTNLALKATKDIRVADSWSIPIFGQIVANPRSEKAYFVVGVTLQP